MKPKTAQKSSATQLKGTLKPAKKFAAKKVSRHRKVEEQSLHMNAVQWFKKAYPNMLAFHVPNGEVRNQHVAEKLQRMGVLPGVFDWLMFPGMGKIAVEFKRKDGDLSDAQKQFVIAWLATGGKCASVRTMEQFIEVCSVFCGPSFIDLANKNPISADLGVQVGI